MNPIKSCAMRSAIDDHFSGSISPRLERVMREHLPNCPDCQAYYRRHLILSGLDPQSPDVKTRLGRGLGFKPIRARLFIPAAVLATGMAVLVAALWWPGMIPEHTGFRSRGGLELESSARLSIYRLASGQAPRVVGGEVSATDELAFAYEMDIPKKRIMVFGVDELDNVYWYFPAWQDGKDTPVAISIDSSSGIHELREAVTHTIQGTNLVIYGIFTDRALSVREVEAWIQGQPFHSIRLPLSDALQVSVPLQVRH